MTRDEWIIRLGVAENDLEMAECDARDHDGSEIDAPRKIAAAKAKIAELMANEPPK